MESCPLSDESEACRRNPSQRLGGSEMCFADFVQCWELILCRRRARISLSAAIKSGSSSSWSDRRRGALFAPRSKHVDLEWDLGLRVWEAAHSATSPKSADGNHVSTRSTAQSTMEVRRRESPHAAILPHPVRPPRECCQFLQTLASARRCSQIGQRNAHLYTAKRPGQSMEEGGSAEEVNFAGPISVGSAAENSPSTGS